MEGLKAAVAEAAEGEKIWTAKHEALLELLTLEELAISTAAPSTMQDGNGEAGAREADDPAAAFAKACTDYSVVLPVGAAGAAFQPRGSQLQLARAALLGRCCVVVDPPGAGKTLGMLVAGLIACQKAGKRLVCVLYEPTVDLVEEVCSRINEYTRPGFAVHTNPATPYTEVEGGAEGGGLAEAAAAAIEALDFAYTAGGVEEQLLHEGSGIHFVVTTPEKGATPAFVQCLAELQSRGQLGPQFVDEAHLIAQWGSVFREAYLRLGAALRCAFGGSLGGSEGGTPVQAMLLSGSMNELQARESARLLDLDPERTDFHMHCLDRPELEPTVLDLTYIDGTRNDVLREAARLVTEGCIREGAVQAVVSVDTVADVKLVAGVMNHHGNGLVKAIPYYRDLDQEAPGGRAAALVAWAEARDENCVGVLVCTVLGAHGINAADVDFTASLKQGHDPRTLSQEIGRACRRGQQSKGNWLVRHPLLIASAGHLVDFKDATAAAAHRKMAQLVAAGRGTCRRAHLLRMLGSIPADKCSGCDGCGTALSPQPLASYNFSQCNDAAIALLCEIGNCTHHGNRANFTAVLKNELSTWRQHCGSVSEANTLFLQLYADGVLDLAVDETNEHKHLHVLVSPEAGARIRNREESVWVSCLVGDGGLVEGGLG